MIDDKPLPCPFCGNNTVYTAVDAGQGNKWGFAHCGQCGAQAGDVRTGYDEALDAPWRAEAIAEWNNRALPAVSAPDVAELVKALRECTEWMESLRASGDAGFWDWKDDEYTRAIAALAKIKEPTP
jgi:Lar family restriction alleviation protein